MSSPARDALDALVAQFSERSAFVRELIQNSLDAGAGRVDLVVKQQKRRLVIDVIDDGEGMDRHAIETYLLTLFRSSKEKDLTKIGKFGIGFVSLFALQPELVVVDTARDGVHHRVVFDADRSYTLAEVDEPFEGTRVRLYVKTWGKKAEALAGELRQAVHYWCRYAKAEVWTLGKGKAWSWDEEVRAEWTVDAVVHHTIEEPGFRCVVGLWPERLAPVAYLNRGLTLLEGKEDAVPGVTFRVEAAEIEHTLTRDNVLRDGGFHRVVARIRAEAEGPLRAAWMKEVDKALRSRDLERLEVLMRAGRYRTIPNDLDWIPLASGGWTSLDELDPPVLSFGPRSLWLAESGGALVDAFDEPVLLGPRHRVWVERVCERWGRYTPRPVEDNWICTQLGPEPRVAAAMRAAGESNPAWKVPIVCAHFHGSMIRDRLAIWQEEPGSVQERPDTEGTLVVNVDHPGFARASRLPDGVGGTTLLVAAMRAAGDGRLITSGLGHDLL